MKKILYVVSTLKRAGPVNQLFNLVKYLDRSIYEPLLLTLSSEPGDSRWNEYGAIGVKLHSLSLGRIRGIISGKKKVEELIGVLRPDLIHTQGIRPDITASKIGAAIPKIATVHNFPQIDYLMTYGRLQGNIMEYFHTGALKKVNIIVGVSQSVSDNLIERYGLRNVRAVQNGVDTENYSPVGEIEKNDIREKLSLPVSARIFISSGHLRELKDPFFLIKAWQKFFHNSSSHLVFVGDGTLIEECKNLSKNSSNIHIVGRVKNVADYLRASDVFVSASKAEGLPNAVIEALACGLPVVLSNIPPHREILEIDTNIGEHYKLGDIDDFYKAIGKIDQIDDSIRKKSGMDVIENHLSAMRMSQLYQNHYYELLQHYGCMK